MHKTNRQLVVYLSKSLKVEESKLQEVRDQLTSCGFLINEFKKGDKYDRALRHEADFVLLVPHLPTLENTHNCWWTNVGKGQFSEVQEACTEDQPVFIYMGYEEGEIMMTKCHEDSGDHWTENTKDWKSNYGTVCSYTISGNEVPLYDFITGYMNMSHNIKHPDIRVEYPLTTSEAFRGPQRLLLL